MTTQIRPRMRTDMAFLETPDGVYVRGHGDGFVIKGAGAYRYLSALLPHLDGSTPLDDLLDGLPPAHATSVRSLIMMLAAKGVITDAPERSTAGDERFAGQIGLLAQYGDDGSGFQRAATAKVLVVSDEPDHADRLADALTANGVGSAGWVRTASDEEADLICLVAADRPSPALFDLAERARVAGAAFVPLIRVGDRLVLGPWQQGDRADVHSAVLRMTDNAIPGTQDLWQALSSLPPKSAELPNAAVSIAISIAGFEIFKMLTGVIAGDIDDAVVVVDPDRLTVGIERLVAHPASPHAVIAPPVKADDPDATPSERVYQRFEPVMARTVGIMRAFDDDALSQIPVKVSAVLAPAADPAPVVAFGSETLLEARVAALEEASLRYALTTARRCGGLPAPGEDAEVVTADRLTTWLGARADDVFVRAVDLNGAPLAVPRAAVLAGPWDRKNARFEPDLVGVATTVEKALIAALGAYTINDGLVAMPVTTEDTRLAMLLDAAGEPVELYRAAGIVPVAVARTAGELTARAGLSWAEAAESALLALVGVRQLPEGDWCLPAAPVIDGFSLGAVAEDDDTSPLDDRLRAAGLRAAVVDLTPADLAGVTSVTRVLLFR
ncbi:hypothetical protein [Herbidospora sp. RD11066]